MEENKMIDSIKKGKKQNLHPSTELEKCPVCGGIDFRRNPVSSEFVCNQCGLVLQDKTYDLGPEWRAFTKEEKDAKRRVGPPIHPNSPNSDLHTYIGWSNTDAHGTQLAPKKRFQMYRLRRWQRQIALRSTRTRSLAVGLAEVNRLASLMRIPPSIHETSVNIYQKMLEKGITRGQSITACAASALYLSCRNHGFPRPLGEFVEDAGVTRRQLWRCVRLALSANIGKFEPLKIRNLISRLATELGMRGETQVIATEIVDEAVAKGLALGKDPWGIAASALYIAGIQNEDRQTQQEISKVAHITEVTLRNRYKELVRKLNIQPEEEQ